MKHCVIFLSLLAIMPSCERAGSQAAQGDHEEPAAPAVSASPGPTTETVSVVEALTASGGRYTQEVREAYLAYAEKEVAAELQKRQLLPSDEFLSWVRSDPVIYETAYGAIYPPDYRILLNIERLKRDMPAERFTCFKQLVLSAAVTRRILGVGARPISGRYGLSITTAHRSDKGAFVEPKPAQATPKPQPQLSRSQKIIDAYLKANDLDARKLYESVDHSRAVMAQLRAAGVKATPGKPWFKMLEAYTVAAGRRPAVRDPHPSVAEYIAYLDRILDEEAKPFSVKKRALKWPLYPVDQAPWPVLMPLTRTMPLREAEDIWNGFQTRQRFQAYGPYRRSDKARPFALEDSKWAFGSWQAHARIGGVCGTMSTISAGTHTALGVPIVKAGQPGHSCTVRYERDGRGFYKTSIGQAVSGPSRTSSSWLFADPHEGGVSPKQRIYGVGMSFHMGLSLAMNVGLREYMDARIAVHIHRMLSAADRTRFSRPLLLSATAINPYHVELWNLLALNHRAKTVPLQQRAEVLRQFNVVVRDSQAQMQPWEERAVDEDLGEGDDNAAANNAPLASHVATWASLVRPSLVALIPSSPIPTDEATLRSVRIALRPAGGANYIRYAMQLPDGRTEVATYFKNQIRKHRGLRGKAKPQLALRTKFEKELAIALGAITEPAKRKTFLADVATAYPPKERSWTFRGKRVGDPIYAVLDRLAEPNQKQESKP